MSETDSTFRSWLAQHPRMIGALFTVLLLLSQSGAAAAGTTVTTKGP